jgi:hypothetical protein
MAYNRTFFLDDLVPSVIENVSSRTRRKWSKVWLTHTHMDNACPHHPGRVQKCIDASRAERLPHPVIHEGWPE